MDLSFLKEIEWIDFDDSDWGTFTFCPFCRNEKRYGHYEGCSLDAAIKQLEGAKNDSDSD